MKRLKIGLMLFIGVLVSGSTMATGILKVDVIPGKKEKALIDVLEAPNSQFKVELKNNTGQVVFTDSEMSPSYNYKKMYDFSDLANGKYTFEVTLGDENEYDQLLVNDGKVQIIRLKEQLTPSFKLDGKFLDFSFLNPNDQGARLLIYDKDTRHWIYQERLIPKPDTRQALNLSKLNSGRYEVVLISGDDTYDFDFNLS